MSKEVGRASPTSTAKARKSNRRSFPMQNTDDFFLAMLQDQHFLLEPIDMIGQNAKHQMFWETFPAFGFQHIDMLQ
jgi:hypothetical protein